MISISSHTRDILFPDECTPTIVIGVGKIMTVKSKRHISGRDQEGGVVDCFFGGDFLWRRFFV